MEYETIDKQVKEATKILNMNKELMDILDYIYKLDLPNYYIAAGCIFQTIWNYYDNKPLNYGIKDIDVIYYNKDDLTIETDVKYYNLIKKYCDKKGYTFEIDVSNEARMHLWQRKNIKMNVEQYKSSEDAINKWIATVHAIGITKEENKLRIYAPYGLSDIYKRIIRPIKHEYSKKEIYEKKAKSWNERFNNVTVIKW